MDGFYCAYLTGRNGTGLLLFAIREDTFIGVDAGGIKYDGRIRARPDGSATCALTYVIPAGTGLITTSQPLQQEQRIPLEVELPPNWPNGQVVGIATPLGPVNAKFQKLREW